MLSRMRDVLPMLPMLLLWFGVRAVRCQKWTGLTTCPGMEPREEGNSFTWKGQMCLIGGRGVLPINCLDPDTLTWSTSKTKTGDIHHIQPVVYQGKVWLVAGWTGPWPNEKQLTHVLTYHPDQDTMRTACPSSIPTEFARGSAGVVEWRGSFYVVQGAVNGHSRATGGRAYHGLSRFDPHRCSWSRVNAPAPRFARDHFEAAVFGSRLVLAAGRDSTRHADPSMIVHYTVAPVEWYDLNRPGSDWQQGASIPTQRAGAAYVKDEASGLLIVLGGESDRNAYLPQCPHYAPQGAHREVEAYRVFEDEWVKLQDMQSGRHSPGAAMLTRGDRTQHSQQYLFVATGVGCTGGRPILDTAEAYLYHRGPYTRALRELADRGLPSCAKCNNPACDQAALSALADGFPCGNRIAYLVDAGLSPTEVSACSTVAKEFPYECGKCTPDPSRSSAGTAGPTSAAAFAWAPPHVGGKQGACRGAGGTEGVFDEVWGATKQSDCRTQCAQSSRCVAYEFGRYGAHSTRCELHSERITHVLPVPGDVVCFTKRPS